MEEDNEKFFGHLRDHQMMVNLFSLSLYVWLVQLVMRKMKEEQGEEDNESAAVGLKLWNSQSHVIQVIIQLKGTMSREYSRLLLKIKNSSPSYTVQ